MHTTKRTIIGLALTATLALGACSKDNKGLGDAPSSQMPDKPVAIWPGPDQFHNIGAYCIGTDAIYIHTREAAPVVVGNSENCQPGGVLDETRRESGSIDPDDLEVVDEGDE